MVTDDEPPRGDIDPLVREGAPHLLVTLRRGRPGRAVRACRAGPPACAASTLTWRSRTLAARWSSSRWPGPPQAAGGTPVDPTLETLALAWAVRDLARYAEGDRPATWSAVVTIDHGGPAVRREWDRHPHCGCAWDEVL